MKKYILSTLTFITSIYTLWYMHFGNITNNDGALSKIGLAHPIYFAIWGVLTYITLFFLITTAYKAHTKYKFQYYFLVVSLIGMLLTITCDFNYNKQLQYYFHCIGSLSFSIVTGIVVFLLFFFLSQKGTFFALCTVIIGLVLISDFVLLLIYKETALIETVPIFVGYILLNIAIYQREGVKIAA